MANDTQNHSPAAPAPLISGDLKKMLVIPLLTMIGAVIIAWFAAQQSQNEMRFKVETLEKNDVAMQQNLKAIIEAQTQFAIAMARFSENQTRLAEDMRGIQADQRSSRQK
jgi:hypothetical protein